MEMLDLTGFKQMLAQEIISKSELTTMNQAEAQFANALFAADSAISNLIKAKMALRAFEAQQEAK